MYREINEKITSPTQEAARRWIMDNIQVKKDDEDLAAWYARTNTRIMEGENGTSEELPEGQKNVKLALNCIDYIGFISGHYWKIEGDALDWISAPVAKVWQRLCPYVRHVRMLRGQADYYAFAETLGELCIQWRHGKGLHDEKYVSQTL